MAVHAEEAWGDGSMMRATFGVIAVLVTACAGPAVAPTTAPSSEARSAAPTLPGATDAPQTADPNAETAIRGWLEAQNSGDLELAASFFASGARIGSTPVTTNSVAEVVEALRPTSVCHHEIESIATQGATSLVEVTISGDACPFLQGAEELTIQIPVQVANGKITCTCAAETSHARSGLV